MWFAGVCILKVFMQMIAPDGALDVVFGYQKLLGKLYSGNKFEQLLGKAIGDCQMCTAFWFMPVWYAAYAFVSNTVLDYWISSNILVNIIWYFVFHSIGAVIGAFILSIKRQKHV